jgi:hypothetical protein
MNGSESQRRKRGLLWWKATERTTARSLENGLHPYYAPSFHDGIVVRDIWFRCETKEAQCLRAIDWSKACPGIEVRRPKYGVVIHGIPVDEIDPHQDNMEDRARDMEIQNEKL